MAQNPHAEVPLRHVVDEPPPFLGEWRRVYVFVLCWLAVVIVLFYAFSRMFAP